MRKREPGFYVAVVSRAMGPVELLDGPWPNLQAAARRAEEIAAQQPQGEQPPQIVEVEADGVTLTRSGPGRED